MAKPDIDIKIFDAALEQHMSREFGQTWRSMCHQSAKVATKALRLLAPGMPAALTRVELAAYMDRDDGDTQLRLVHIGWNDDPRPMNPSEVRAHFAVVIEKGLYDPTFWQLGTRKTPLDLPSPFFFADDIFTAPLGFEAFHWLTALRPTGKLRIGYKLQPAPLSSSSTALLMTDAEAKPHARRVAGIYRNLCERKS